MHRHRAQHLSFEGSLVNATKIPLRPQKERLCWNTIPFPGEHAPAANPEEQSDVSFPFLPGGAPPASTTPNPNRSQQPQPHLCSIRPRSPASGSSSHLGSLSGFRRAGLEGSQGLPELKLSALLSLNPLQNPSKNPSRSSLTAPPQKFSLGTIPLQTQWLGCSRSLFFSKRNRSLCYSS